MQNDIQQLLNAADQVILGKGKQIRLAVGCLLALVLFFMLVMSHQYCNFWQNGLSI
jgi:hypothetical protein